MTEFGFIDSIKTLFAPLPDNGFEGIGDDCSVLSVGGGESLVFTADLLTEGVHFLRTATSPRELGRKSLAVNLSDVAAMGARPVATLLSIALPADAADAWAAEFMLGYRELSEEFGVTLAGGDTTRSLSGLTINVTAIGRAADAHLKRRSDARPGDVIFTAGELGTSGAGLQDILAGRCDTPAAAVHRNPQPQVAEGIWLGSRPEVRAMMDLSDGLASDLKHILDRSGVGAEVAVEQIPAAPGADVRMAACSGEDYKLLLTAAPEAAERLAADFRIRFGTPLHPIGRITSGPGLVWLRNGKPEPLTGTASSIINGWLAATPSFAGRLLKYVLFALHESTRKRPYEIGKPYSLIMYIVFVVPLHVVILPGRPLRGNRRISAVRAGCCPVRSSPNNSSARVSGR